MLLTFILSLERARLEKELKDGSTACVTAIKRFEMTSVDSGGSNGALSLFAFLPSNFYMTIEPSANKSDPS